MPLHEYRCSQGHVTERFFKSIHEGDVVNYIDCPHCLEDGALPLEKVIAHKIPSVPLQAHLYGDPAGYDKPSPTKRFNTKTVSRKTGNDSALG